MRDWVVGDENINNPSERVSCSVVSISLKPNFQVKHEADRIQNERE